MRVLTHRIEKQVSPWEYLVIWVGLVGGVVGLSISKESVVEKLASTDGNHVS